MAFVKMTLREAQAVAQVNRDKVEATTEADIARFNAEDGFDPEDTLEGLRRVYSPAEIRGKVGLTQAEMAYRLGLPVKIWRSWEQGRGALEPSVRALLALVDDNPARAFEVLRPLFVPEQEARRSIPQSMEENADEDLA